jgi:hypothetical protein
MGAEQPSDDIALWRCAGVRKVRGRCAGDASVVGGVLRSVCDRMAEVVDHTRCHAPAVRLLGSMLLLRAAGRLPGSRPQVLDAVLILLVIGHGLFYPRRRESVGLRSFGRDIMPDLAGLSRPAGFADGSPGNSRLMTEQRRFDLHPTDEPDGSTAYEASLRPAGDSVTTSRDATSGDAPADAAPDDEVLANVATHDRDDDFDSGEDAGEDTGTTGLARAGYDPDAVSGDTEAYRPQ